MKIAQVVCVYPPYAGGIGQAAFHFSKELSRHNHDVTVFTPKYQEEKHYIHHGVRVKYLKPVLKLGNAALNINLIKNLKKYQYIILHYPFFGGSEVLYLGYKFGYLKAPLLIHYHMDTEDLGLVKNLFSIPSALIKNDIFNIAKKISFASRDYITYSKVSGLLDIKKGIEIPFGVNLNDYKYLDYSQKKHNQLLFVGGLDKAHYFKGLRILMRTFKELPSFFNLKVVGDGDLKAEYIKFAKKLNILNRIKFVGKLEKDELIKAYQESALFILPSVNRHEAFGLVLIEAMACGTPVVATNLPGVRKVFKEGVQGYISEPGDTQSLKGAIHQFFNSDKKRMSIEARKLVEEKYDWRVIGNKLNSVLLK